MNPFAAFFFLLNFRCDGGRRPGRGEEKDGSGPRGQKPPGRTRPDEGRLPAAPKRARISQPGACRRPRRKAAGARARPGTARPAARKERRQGSRPSTASGPRGPLRGTQAHARSRAGEPAPEGSSRRPDSGRGEGIRRGGAATPGQGMEPTFAEGSRRPRGGRGTGGGEPSGANATGQASTGPWSIKTRRRGNTLHRYAPGLGRGSMGTGPSSSDVSVGVELDAEGAWVRLPPGPGGHSSSKRVTRRRRAWPDRRAASRLGRGRVI